MSLDLAKAQAYNRQRHAEKHFEALEAWGWLPVSVVACSPGSAEEAQAVATWQTALGLTADGCCGPGTWAAARKLAWPAQPPIPQDRAAMLAIYGDPKFKAFPNPQTTLDKGRLVVDPAWKAQNQAQVKLNGRAWPCHKLVGPELEVVHTKAVQASGYDPKCGGVMVARRRNWSADPADKPSDHSWGTAVDWDTQANARGLTDTPMRRNRIFVAVYEVAGWVWGGHFTPTDDMHFQRGRGF